MSAWKLASMMLTEQPTVVQERSPSLASISTRVTAPVALLGSRIRTLIVGELHSLQLRVKGQQRLAHGLVQRVHRAIALGGGVHDLCR